MVIERPHFVPRTYLRAWADSNGKLLAYRRRGDNARRAGVNDVAVVGGIYGRGELGDANEKMYQGVEAEWPNPRCHLIAQGDLQGDQRNLFALFAALQLVRTEKHVERTKFISNVAATTAECPVPKDAVRDYLRNLGGEPDESEVEGAWTYVGCDRHVRLAHSRLGAQRCRGCCGHTDRASVGNDELDGPQVPRPPADQQRFPGSSVAPADPKSATSGPRHTDCGRGQVPAAARCPASDGLRALDPNPAVERAQPRAINAEIARQCHQFVFGTIGSMAAIDRLPLWTRRPDFDSA